MTLQSPPLRISLLIRQLRPHLHPPPRRAFTTSHPYLSSTPTTSITPPLPTIPTCPPSHCNCASTPPDLAIDREGQLNGTMPPYVHHVVIHTGRDDWSSRIEDEPATLGAGIGGGNFARALKGLVGRGGRFHDPARPVLITNSSIPRNALSGETSEPKANFQAVHVYPQNNFVPQIPDTPEGYEMFVRTFLESSAEETPMVEEKKAMKREDGSDETGVPVPEQSKKMDMECHHISYPSIFICGHNSRDTRCGVLGPLLLKEFKRRLAKEKRSRNTQKGQWNFTPNEGGLSKKARDPYAVLALVSHIGGHKFAGNVVIYFPEKWKSRGKQEVNPLAGKGIWYGRVEPKHVWGIMEETIKGGRIIEELLRGIQSPQDRVAVLDSELGRLEDE